MSNSRRKTTARAARSADPGKPRRSGSAAFSPPHCPHRTCRSYRGHADWNYSRVGTRRLRGSRRRLQRFRCLSCGRSFSQRSFAATYWLHRPALLTRIASLSIAGAGLRQIGRELGVSHSTVARHLARAGRHCLLFHRRMLEGVSLDEAVAFDGFETFEYSQFFPFHLNLAAGRESWFLYHFTDSPLRRKGTMTAGQKVERARLESLLGRPHPKAVENGVYELLRMVIRQMPALSGRGTPAAPPTGASPGARAGTVDRPLFPIVSAPGPCRGRQGCGGIQFHSDEHPAYVRALRRLRQRPGCPLIAHLVTPSTEPRTCANPLFPVNLAETLLRHCGANHRRETIAFSKRRQSAIERLAIFTVWRNAIKWRREKRPGETAAMQAGILDRPIDWETVFARRLFPQRRRLPGVWWSYYWRRVRTPVLGDRQNDHRLRYAF